MNHGHVIPNPDGSRARCGGPAICDVCAREEASAVRESKTSATPELTKGLTKDQAEDILQQAFKAAGIQSYHGVIRMGDRVSIHTYNADLIMKGGMLKFMTTALECELVDVCSPRKATEKTPA